MHIALIGPTGFVGTPLLNELLQRGHRVTALARDPSKLAPRDGLTVVQADATDSAQVARAVQGVDAVASAYNPGWTHADLHDEFLRGSRAITEGVKAAGVQRLLVVGGAGSLYVAPGLQLIDTPQFPAEYKAGAEGARQALALLRQETALDWTFISPPVGLAPGERTGNYRTGADDVLMNGEQPAGISVADLAVAIVDEVEKPRHVRARFTVASK
jgi:hypothetical protein